MSTPITKRFPGLYCFRARVWTPTSDAMSHESVQVEGGTPREVAELMIALMIHGNRLNRRALDQLGYMAKSLREVVHNEREDRSP